MKNFMHKKWLGIPALAIIAVILAVGVVAAATSIWIYSNQVTVSVTAKPVPPVYTLKLNQPDNVYVNEPITFTGQLTATEGAKVSGQTILLFSDTSGATPIATVTTIAGGFFTASYTPTVIGSPKFNATFDSGNPAP